MHVGKTMRTILFIIMVLVIIMTLALWGFLTHGISEKESILAIIGGAIGALFGIIIQASASLGDKK